MQEKAQVDKEKLIEVLTEVLACKSQEASGQSDTQNTVNETQETITALSKVMPTHIATKITEFIYKFFFSDEDVDELMVCIDDCS